ncbi:MAG: hypothetical protein ACK5JS_09490 [Mangrovibacterium sp.]
MKMVKMYLLGGIRLQLIVEPEPYYNLATEIAMIINRANQTKKERAAKK